MAFDVFERGIERERQIELRRQLIVGIKTELQTKGVNKDQKKRGTTRSRRSNWTE